MIHGTYTKMNAPFPVASQFAVTLEAADQAYERVLANSGAMPRDAADSRVVAGVRNQTGRIIKSQTEVGGWPELKSTPARLDSDGDGLPDEWERAHGLNPKDASDDKQPAKDGSGYSNLEIYLNSLAK